MSIEKLEIEEREATMFSNACFMIAKILTAIALLIVLICLFASCSKSKDEPTCKTCDVQYESWASNDPDTLSYIESSTQYCGNEWQDLDGNIDHTHWVTMGVTYNEKRTTHCHE